MRSSSREEVVEVFDALEAGYKRALDLRCDALTTPERLARAAALRADAPLAAGRRTPADQPAQPNRPMPTELGGKLAAALANRLRISRAEASRRIHEAADLGERRALNGEPLAPVLPATAEAQRNGDLGAGHVAVIRSFWHRLPDFVDIETRAQSRSTAGPTGRRAPPRRVGQAGRHPHRLPQPRRRLHRHRPRPAPRHHHRPPRHRRHVADQRLSHPRSPRHPRRGLRQARRAGHVQLRRRRAVRQRHPVAGRHPGRHPQRRRSATTTPCSPPPARSWPPETSVSTTACPPASSSPPRCKNSKPAPAKRSPAAAPCCRCRM